VDTTPRILVVDDTPANIKLLDAVLSPRGYEVLTAASGPEALEVVERDRPDLVLLDILMPGMDGYEVCRRLRVDPLTAVLPVIMITASGAEEKLKAIEAGADDFVVKPFDQAELLARVKSLLRVKEYHDIIQGQAAELAEWNRTLEARVTEQVEELERLSRLRRFLSPQIADLIVSNNDETVLKSHRREVAVLFCDLRGFTAFAEAAEPEEITGVLRDFHDSAGRLINAFGATVGYLAGDGLMVFFNDPLPCANPAQCAVTLAVSLRDDMAAVAQNWSRLGHELGFGVGIAFGYATLGEVGFQGRYDYAVIGSVTNLAARLCGEAKSGEILIAPRVQAAVEELVESQRLPDVTLKGFHKPVPVYNVVSLKGEASPLSPGADVDASPSPIG
jgi:adenylate cyclase